MSYKCTTCEKRVEGNDGQLLISLPEYVRNAYPVDPRFAQKGSTFHIDTDCCDLLDQMMPTYGNGDKLSRLLFSKINKTYLRRLAEYLSFWKAYQMVVESSGGFTPPMYPTKDGEFITTFPPTGEALRDMFDNASSSSWTCHGVSDHARCTREIQSVGTDSMFAQDHTMEVTKNYRKGLGAFAVWDCTTETGEIAAAVIVGTTKAADLAHAAESLSRRPHFNPKAMYSDTWPHKEGFWKLLFG